MTDILDKKPKAKGNASDRSSKTLIDIPETTLSDEEVLDKLIKARIEMLMSAPFFGNLATRLILKDATEWCPTAATDGKYFYYNKHFVAALSDEETVFLMGHEVLHCVYDHMDITRRGDRHPVLWNIANDYVINADLIDARVGEEIKIVQICHDWKYRGKISEEIYDDLFQQMEENGQVMEIPMDTLDVHLDREEGDDGSPDSANKGNTDGDEEGKDGPAQYTAEEKEQIKQEFQNATMQAAKAAGAGNLPGGVKRLLDKFLNPQLDWRTLLAMQIQSVMRSDYTMQTPSRKGRDEGYYFPGLDRETTIDIFVSLDMSGSIYDSMATDFLGEVKGVMDQYTDFKIHLVCFDTDVYNYQVFDQSNMGEFMEYELAGGGGTDFDCVFDSVSYTHLTLPTILLV